MLHTSVTLSGASVYPACGTAEPARDRASGRFGSAADCPDCAVQGNSPMETARDQTISGDSNRGGAKQKREDAADRRWENLESAVGKGANQIRDRSGCDANVC